MSGDDKKLGPWVTAFSAIASLLLAYNTYQVSQFDADLRAVESEREVNFRIFQSIAEAVESGNPQRIRAVRALVTALASDSLREGFLDALEMGEVQIFEGGEATKTRARLEEPSFDWEDWDYDVFWCSSAGAVAESQANAIVEALEMEDAKGRLRVRVLPESVRNSSAYNTVSAYEIRYEENEQDQAAAVARLADRTLGGQAFTLVPISPARPTPWYVSVFICPTSTPQRT